MSGEERGRTRPERAALQIGFDISQTGAGKAGCGYYAHAIAKAMPGLAPEHRYALFPSFGNYYFDPRMPLSNPYPARNSKYGPRHVSREMAAMFWEGPAGTALMSSLDIVHANNYWCPVQPVTSRVVYTLYDLTFATGPQWTTERNRQGCFDGVFRAAVAADWIVAISEASRSHYLRLFPSFPPERIRVVHPCSRFDDASATGARPPALQSIEPERFWLSVGTIEPRKNQRRLVEAYVRYRKAESAPMPLVLAGGPGWLMDDFRGFVEELGIVADIVMTGYVSDQELIWLYRNCFANLYPSLSEGFGLPVLEGMQFGAATVAADNTSLPEVAGGAAILIAAEDIDAWAGTMTHLQAHPEERKRMKAASIERSRAFDWRTSAQTLLDLYDEAARSPKRTRRS